MTTLSKARTQSRNHRGFTLAEVLVTIAIIAIMAAVLLPALNNQLTKGDTSRISSDLTNLQSGIQAFFSDIRQYPKTTGELVSPLTASSTDFNGNVFQPSAISAWKGPYVSRDVLSNTGGRATFDTTFTATATSSTNFLTVSIYPITSDQFANIEGALDEGTSGATSTTGQIRYAMSGTTGVLSFLAMPIQ
jgi:prepilin-type N-terminal cleavage/methylation domain-containing protein